MRFNSSQSNKNQPELETDRLAKLIAQKHEILVQLLELVQRQRQIVGEGNMTRLLSLLAAKQPFISQLQEVETDLDPFRSQDPEERHWRSAEFRHTRSVAGG